MAGATSFHIKVTVSNADLLEDLKNRALDLTPLFKQIFEDWVKINAQKFELAQGREASGADIFGTEWEPLTEGYRESKHKAGYDDWLMVRTGELMRSMTDPDLIFNATTGLDAVFGTPLDPEDAAKVAYNWTRRQVIFLGSADLNMIQQYAQAFFQYGSPFEARLAARTTQTQRVAEMERMEADFSNAVGGDEGDWGHD